MIGTPDTVTLSPTDAPTRVNPNLSPSSGAWSVFVFYYTLTRGSTQQTGEVFINDNGTHVEMDHEFNILGSATTLDFQLTVQHTFGIRELLYTLNGTDDATFTYLIDKRF